MTSAPARRVLAFQLPRNFFAAYKSEFKKVGVRLDFQVLLQRTNDIRVDRNAVIETSAQQDHVPEADFWTE